MSLLSSRDSKNDDDDDNDSAIDEDSEPTQSLSVPGVILRRGAGAKGINAVNRWSTTSSIDIEADFEVMANKVQELINKLCIIGDSVILIGDYNVAVYRPGIFTQI